MVQKNSTAKSLRPKDINIRFVKPLEYISFSPPALGEEEEREVLNSLRSGWITTGPKVKEFENKLARFVRAKEAVALSSCTDAMHLSLRTLGVKDKDEVKGLTKIWEEIRHGPTNEATGKRRRLIEPAYQLIY